MRCCDKLLSYVLEAIYCIFLNFDTQLIHNYEFSFPYSLVSAKVCGFFLDFLHFITYT